jgi:uncharacterized Zn finger protein
VDEPPEPTETLARPRGAVPVHAAEIVCDTCGRRTVHRILRLDPVAAGDVTGPVQGLARCRECRWVHPFRVEPPTTRSVALIRSEGPSSRREVLRIDPGLDLVVGGPVPGLEEPLRIVRIDLLNGRSGARARAGDVATIWSTPDRGPMVPVSIVEGRRTRTTRLALPTTERLTVGEPLRVEDRSYTIHALRAEGRTWRVPGDSFAVPLIARVYVRRTVIPPAGSRDWSRDRDSPSSRASSISRSPRSRSSPGVSRNRTRPRDWSAAGGATLHSSSSS